MVSFIGILLGIMGEILNQIVVPKMHRYQIMHTAHDRPLGVILGTRKLGKEFLITFTGLDFFQMLQDFVSRVEIAKSVYPRALYPVLSLSVWTV